MIQALIARLTSHLAYYKLLNHEELIGILCIEYESAYVTINDQGNQVIDKKLLKAFKKITETTVVWDRAQRAWRLREEHDLVGSRMQ
ncbi:hypothetical protein OW684_04970 [Acinetobacter baumannii]|uniref:DUF6953 family protein n=1 Tax=Acinetobacter baumannii TaxID=470 RepID=UPI0013C7FBA3|nr:hypothetical protein [Acinetobacter baumannii]MDC5073483.1 hypothetical protein [Acinetobacter baumannii]MDC5221653.1 hypothetical protein [Acinetobacter baumannii]MDH2477386.1 hypothetical protein [Acinetobacter baumannii]MDH2484765.1 hypothetical protein [Acinetobacter baumannii]MDH2518558.1 hypothetical protein [Acinetobacter baumannii]